MLLFCVSCSFRHHRAINVSIAGAQAIIMDIHIIKMLPFTYIDMHIPIFTTLITARLMSRVVSGTVKKNSTSPFLQWMS
jgi:hypothetical protein